jgi:hypothetical protein
MIVRCFNPRTTIFAATCGVGQIAEVMPAGAAIL